MQEFRPAVVIEADTALARSLQTGDLEALAQLVARYGGPVTGLATHLTGSASLGHELAHDVFVSAWRNSCDLEPGNEFAPWLTSTTLRLAKEVWASNRGASDGEIDGDEVERVWSVSSATSNLPDDRHELLRSFYVAGVLSDDRAPDVARDRNQIERRLGHLDASQVISALADANSWVRPDPALADRVCSSAAGDAPADAPTIGLHESMGDVVGLGSAAAVGRGRSARSALAGFGAAFVVLFGGIAVLSSFSGSGEQANFTIDLIPTGVVADAVGGTMTVTERDAGLELQLDAPTLPKRSAGAFYEGVLVLDTGDEMTAGTFFAGSDVTLWGGVAIERVRAFRVILGEFDGPQSSAESATSTVLKADFPTR